MPTSSLSPIYTITTEAMVGMVILDPADPSNSALELMYGVGRSESISLGNVTQQFVTERYPEYTFGTSETAHLSLNIVIPFDEMHDHTVAAFERLVAKRKTIVYRDNRARFVYGVLMNFTKSYAKHGTEIKATLAVTEYFQ